MRLPVLAAVALLAGAAGLRRAETACTDPRLCRGASWPSRTARCGSAGRASISRGASRAPACPSRLRNGTGRLRLLIDGVEKERFGRSGTIDVRIDGLSDGEHRFRLEKLSETQGDTSSLIGFFPAVGGTPLSPPARTGRQIEFIGDSHSVGCGDTSSSRTCTAAELRDTTRYATGLRAEFSRDASARITV